MRKIVELRLKQRRINKMDEYPELSETFIDFMVLDFCVIVALPTYLAIGYVHYKNNQIYLKENCYLKIYLSFYELWFVALEKMQKYLSHLPQTTPQEPKEGLITKWLTNQLSWRCQFEDKSIEIFLKNSSKNGTIIKLNIIDFDIFCRAIQQLFFKPFCFKPIVNITFLQIISHLESIENGDIYISNLNYQESVDLVKKMNIFQSDSELFLMCELILRYKNELLLSYLLKINSYFPNVVLKRYSKKKKLKK